jgi:large subunit ribosomal protein L31
MRSALHPPFYSQARVTCACGASFLTGSTQPQMQVETCSVCHPFFTTESRPRIANSQAQRFARRYAQFSNLIATSRS